MTNKEFYDKDFMQFCSKEYEAIRVRRKKAGKPKDDYDRIEIQLDRIFEAFYKTIIN